MRTERRCQAIRWIRVRPGWFNRPALDRFWRNRGERSGECGGDGLLCPLLGSRLYGCIGISALCLRHVTLSLSVSCDLGFLKQKFERENGGFRKECVYGIGRKNEEWRMSWACTCLCAFWRRFLLKWEWLVCKVFYYFSFSFSFV